MNQRPSGYEPDELPGCSTPQSVQLIGHKLVECRAIARTKNRASVLLLVFALPQPLQLVKAGFFCPIVKVTRMAGERWRRDTSQHGRVALGTCPPRRLVEFLQLLEALPAVRTASLFGPADVLADRHDASRESVPRAYLIPASAAGAAAGASEGATTMPSFVFTSACWPLGRM